MERVIKIMPCLDMKDGRVVKGVHFVNLIDAGDPVESAKAYCDSGADMLALLDIMATVEGRRTMLDVVRRTAAAVSVPFVVGGGIGSIEDIDAVLGAGATQVSISSAAFRRPELIEEAAAKFGRDRVVVAVDVDRSQSTASGYEVYIDGGRTATGRDAIEWSRRAVELGAGTLLPTSKACDGAKNGYDVELNRQIAEAVDVPVVASGGAGTMEHFYDAATQGKSEILLAASVFHFGMIRIPELKRYLRHHGLNVVP